MCVCVWCLCVLHTYTGSGGSGGGGGQRAARINMWTTMMLDFEGSNAVLFCRAEGSPRPTVTWIDPEDHHVDADHDQYLVCL